LKLNDGEIGARRSCGGEPERQEANSQDQSLHCRLLTVIPQTSGNSIKQGPGVLFHKRNWAARIDGVAKSR
jgi:hypothetical protein